MMAGPDGETTLVEKQCEVLRLDALVQEGDCSAAVVSIRIAVYPDSRYFSHPSSSPRSDVVDVLVGVLAEQVTAQAEPADRGDG